MRILKLSLILVVLFLLQVSWAQTARTPADVEKRVDSILNQMTLEEKIDLIGGTDTFYIRPLSRLKFPALRMSDGPLGVHDYGPTTAYPAPIALAASWDMDLARRVGNAMGNDARARGVNFILAPGMNIYRAPMCGRNFEYLGEDPFLASRTAVSLIQGIQERGVIATAKHYMGNNQEFDRMEVSSDIDERTLREIYLPAFEASVREAHVGAIMDSYNLVNGIHLTQHDYLNNQVLKKEWGFDGIVMSDWGATHDGVAAANGGLDLEMPSGDFMNRTTLIPAIQQGKVPIATIDDKVRRILRKAIEFRFYDRDQLDSDLPAYSPDGREVALQVAREGMVLLKNEDGILPLDKKKLKTIAVLGPNAYPAVVGGGGSSLTKPFNAISALEGLSNYAGKQVRVLYAIENPPLADMFEHSQFVSPTGEAGLRGEYFDNQDLAGPPAMVRTDAHINFHFGDGSFAPGHPVDHFSIRWSGDFIPKTTGDYKFYTNSDDGVRLYLNGQRVINDWQRHEETVNSYTAHLTGGKAYHIVLEYFEAVGGATVGFGVIDAERSLGPETKAIAKRADVVVLCLGFDSNSEAEGSDRTFGLPGAQESLIRQITELNKNVVVVLNAGGNVDMNGWLGRVPALLHAWYPGQEGGTALAQILFGEYSPSGKLPVSFERRWEDNPTFNSYYPANGEKKVAYKEGIFLGYRHFDKVGIKPLFPFGFGLSYTTFQYSNLKIAKTDAGGRSEVTVSFSIKNTGKRRGAEVTQLYVGDSHSSVPRPTKELKGFAKVDLNPGESKTVTLKLDRRSFSYYDVAGKQWKAEPGKFAVLIGSSSQKTELNADIDLSAAEIQALGDPFISR
jgi:beta-glucosidase